MDRTFAFGQVKSGDKVLGANEQVVVSSGMAGNDNGNQQGDNGGKDSTMSGGTVDSAWIKATWRPYGVFRCQW